MEFFNFLNQNSGTFLVIFTAIVAISTGVYAYLTIILVGETRKMRNAQTEPCVNITYKPRNEWLKLIDIAIKNIGLGPAHDIKFDIIPLTKDEVTIELIEELKEKRFLSSGLNYLSPGQEISSFFTNTNTKFKGKMASRILIKASYKNAVGKNYSNEYMINLSELEGIIKIGQPPPLYKIAKDIEVIKDEIKFLTSGFKRLNTDIYTSEDRQKEKTELKKRLEKPKKKEG